MMEISGPGMSTRTFYDQERRDRVRGRKRGQCSFRLLRLKRDENEELRGKLNQLNRLNRRIQLGLSLGSA